MIVDRRTGEQAEPMLVDRKSGRPLVEPDFRSAVGPGVDPHIGQRHLSVANQQAFVQSLGEPVR